MGVIPYKKEVSPGVFKEFYMVIAEAINKYTGKRVQKKRRSIPSIPKAERIYRELWNQCLEEKPNSTDFTHWGPLVEHYFRYLEKNVRSPENRNGFSPMLVKCKKSRCV